MKLSLSENPYRVLGVERTATEAEIKQAYFALVREHPPERDPEGFKRIRAAYEKLRAGTERAQTNLLLIDEQPLTLEVETLKRHAVVPRLTPEQVAADLLALEAILLLEELRSPTADGAA